jgi:hypothetical protein
MRRGERLTGRTSYKNSGTARLEQRFDILGGQRTDILPNERSLVVGHVGKAARFVDIDACREDETFRFESVGQPACSAKEIDD